MWAVFLYANAHSIFFIFLFDSASPIKVEFHSLLSIQSENRMHTHLQFVRIHTRNERSNHLPMLYLIRTNFMHIHLTLQYYIYKIYSKSNGFSSPFSLACYLYCIPLCIVHLSDEFIVCSLVFFLVQSLFSFWLHVYLVLILLICTIHVSKALELHTMHSYYLCTEWRMHQVHRIYGHFCISMLFYGNVIRFISHSFRWFFLPISDTADFVSVIAMYSFQYENKYTPDCASPT